MTNARAPKHAEIWPLMGIHSQDTKHGGAWRLTVLFQALDHNDGCNHPMGICKGGTGRIERAQLETAALKDMKVKRSTYFSWLADARKWGIISGRGEYLYLASQQKLAKIFLCNSIDRRKVTIPLKLLFKAGWKDIVFAAYLKANHYKRSWTDKPNSNKPQLIIRHGSVGIEARYPVYNAQVASAKTHEDITGINPRTQRRMNGLVKSEQQIAVTNIAGSWETAAALNKAAKDHGQHRHYFVFNDPQQEDPNKKRAYRRVIAYTLPAKRKVNDKTAMPAGRGRRRQILKSLQLVNFAIIPNSSARPQQAGPLTEGYTEYTRRYLETPKQIERNLRGYIPRVGRFGRVRKVWDEKTAPTKWEMHLQYLDGKLQF